MPQTFTPDGNHAQCLAYRAACAETTAKDRARAIKRKITPVGVSVAWESRPSRRAIVRSMQIERVRRNKAKARERKSGQ